MLEEDGRNEWAFFHCSLLVQTRSTAVELATWISNCNFFSPSVFRLHFSSQCLFAVDNFISTCFPYFPSLLSGSEERDETWRQERWNINVYWCHFLKEDNQIHLEIWRSIWLWFLFPNSNAVGSDSLPYHHLGRDTAMPSTWQNFFNHLTFFLSYLLLDNISCQISPKAPTHLYVCSNTHSHINLFCRTRKVLRWHRERQMSPNGFLNEPIFPLFLFFSLFAFLRAIIPSHLLLIKSNLPSA